MSLENKPEILNTEDLSSMYDNPVGEIPAIPIGHISHMDGNGHKKTEAEVAELKDVATEVGAEVTDRPHGEHNSTVIRHKAWVWVGGVIGTTIGLVGLGTAFAIEHHRRKNRKPQDK